MSDLRERARTSFIEVTTYDWAVEHEPVAGVLGRLIWGTDTSAFYRDIACLGQLQTCTRVLDVPAVAASRSAACDPSRRLITSPPTSRR